MKTIFLFCITCLCTFIWFPTSAIGAQHVALIVGVSKYPVAPEQNNLPSPQHDAQRMQELLRGLGFKTKTLINEQATPQKIRQGLLWLKLHGHQKENVLVFYYSGHGAQIEDTDGDETDGKDETLFPYAKDPRNPKHHIVDDELRRFSEQVVARVFFILDSCHSGTATKSLPSSASSAKDWMEYFAQRKFRSKRLYIPPKFVTKRKRFKRFKRKQARPKYVHNVLVAAAKDNEKAIDTGQGSILTNAILSIAKSHDLKKMSVTLFFQQIQNYIWQYSIDIFKKSCRENASCNEKYDEKIKEVTMIHHPQLEGNQDMMNQSVFLFQRLADSAQPTKQDIPSSEKVKIVCRGFKSQAKQALHQLLQEMGATAAENGGDAEISHDSRVLRVHYKGRLFLELTAEQSQAKSLMENLKRIVNTLNWLKAWISLKNDSSQLSVTLLTRQSGSAWEPISTPNAKIGTRIRMRLLLQGQTPCYPLFLGLSNQGRIDILYPRTTQTLSLHRPPSSLIIPQGGAFRVNGPNGIGMLMAFCSTRQQDVTSLRSRIAEGVFTPVPIFNDVHRAFFFYYVQP